MSTVSEIINRLFPSGTNPGGKGRGVFPMWPPDLFAIAATLVERSGCYAHPYYAGGGWGGSFHAPRKDYPGWISDVARSWMSQTHKPADSPFDPEILEMQGQWLSLIACGDEIEPCRSGDDPPEWCGAAMWLMAVADEASAGIGSFPEPGVAEANPFVDHWGRNYQIWDAHTYLKKEFGLKDDSAEARAPTAREKERLQSILSDVLDDVVGGDPDLLDRPAALLRRLKAELKLPHLTTSLCQMVPRSEVCVQPKTRTAIVGCTLRSLSHHLALLPPASQVETRWRFGTRTEPMARTQALNLLLVPYPYVVDGTCFEQGDRCVGAFTGDMNSDGVNRARFFAMNQKWLARTGPRKGPAARPPARLKGHEFAREFLAGLIQAARSEVDRVHGLILPELALDLNLAKQVGDELAGTTRLDFFIAGALADARPGRGPKNIVYTCIYERSYDDPDDGQVISRSWEQAKHHRWKLERHQIRRYHLGGRLDPHIDWWEHIDLSPRQCVFGVFRPEACLTALVCEDLARVDPVQAAIRSIGPNLVVALLMDGPQREDRWSGRYATVLADDPGSAVLTLTSVGLLRRSTMPGQPHSSQIALWKDAGGEQATGLCLPDGHHALMLTLSYKREQNFTMDGRADARGTVALTRSGLYPIRHPDPPAWLRL